MGWTGGFTLFLNPLSLRPLSGPSPGSGLPCVRLQWGELLQPHALPGHGLLLHDDAHL